MREVPPSLAWAVLGSLALAVAGAVVGLRVYAPVPAPPAPLVITAPPVLDGRWRAFVAPEETCPGGDDAGAAVAAQEHTMVCLVNFARAQYGLAGAVSMPTLFSSAEAKAGELVRCGRFAHDPCGTGSDAVFRHVAYGSGSAASAWGENLALVSSNAATPRYVLNGWLNSDGHRENLFRADWTEQGVALLPHVDLAGYRDVNVWASHFGFRSKS